MEITPRSLSTEPVDVLPHLLALHRRAPNDVAPDEAAHLRKSVVAASFGRDWKAVHAAHRTHLYQEANLSASPCDLLILHVGKPLRVRLGFAGGKNKTKNVVRGEITLVPKGVTSQWLWEPYGVKETVPRAEFIHLYLPAATLARAAGEMGMDSAPAEIAARLGMSDPILWRIGETLTEEMRHDRAGSRLIADAAACQLAVHLLRRHGASSFAAPRHGSGTPSSDAALAPARLRRATDFIRDHLHRDIALTDIAEAAGMSVFYFARQFKKATGLSPYQFLLRERMERAKVLLQNPQLSIGYVAHMVGYDSHSRFSAQFRRLTGTVPTDYRK